MQKRGRIGRKAQITIFVVIALVIIAVFVTIFLIRSQLAPKIPGTGVQPTQVTSQFEDGIRECVRSNAKDAIKLLSQNAGNPEPELYTRYQDIQYTYLCYNQLSYEACVNQDPFIQETFEREIAVIVEREGKGCVDQILAKARGNGFEVERQDARVDVKIKPGRIEVSYLQSILITKGRDRFSFRRFDVPLASNLGLFLDKTNDIVNSEARVGDYDQLTPMLLTPRLVIQKFRVDGSTLYTLRRDGEEFRFAVRSFYLPAGLY